MTSFAEFEKRTIMFMEKYQVPGCIVAIAKEGNIVYEKAFGYRDVDHKKEIDRHTVFGLASLTKMFTTVAIMQLAEQGKLNIHAPVTIYLPTFKVRNPFSTDITIFHFMTHTSGLPPLPSLDYAMSRKRNRQPMFDPYPISEEKQLKTYVDLINYIADANVELIAEPGKVFSYSNDAYGLLGAIIEKVTGQTYEDYVLENVLKPCGIKHTHFFIENYGGYENITTCYERLEEKEDVLYPVEHWWDAPAMRATGFLKSTAQDLMIFSTLFFNEGIVNGNRILSKESIQQILSPHIKMDPEKYYGFGLAITKDYFEEVRVDHGGSLQSISAKFVMLPEKGVTAIVLANVLGFPATRVAELALNAFEARDLDASHFPKQAFHVKDSQLEKYVGAFESGEGMDVELKMSDSNLQFFYKGTEYPIRFIREHIFLAEIDDAFEPVEIFVDENGVASAISVYHRIIQKR